MKVTDKLTVQTTIDVDFRDIANLLCSAFEGGSSYWAEISDYTHPRNIWPWEAGHLYPYVQYPLSEGGAVIVSDTEDDKIYTLDLAAIQRGIQAMATIAPRHFADLINENIDSETGDVFLQCCVFGEIVYG